MVQKMETLCNRAPEFTFHRGFHWEIDIYDFTASCLSIKRELLPTRKREIKCSAANEILLLTHTWQVTWIRLLIMIWRMYCGNTFKVTEWLINFEVKKFTIISCTVRGEKVHWWRPAGLIMVPQGEPAFPGALSELAGLRLPGVEVQHGHDTLCCAHCCWGHGGLAQCPAESYFCCPAAGGMLGRGAWGSGWWGECSERLAACG